MRSGLRASLLAGFVAIWRLLRIAVHVVHGLLLIWLRFGRLEASARQALVQWWSIKALRLLGVSRTVSGQALAGPKLLLANHVSWLDIAAIHSVMPEARFVSKSDIQHWPIIGLLVTGVGTLYIERSSKRDALRVVHQTAAAMKDGDTVAVFPEGTTGPGPELLPVHANLLQAAIATELPIQPVVLRWHEPGQRFSVAAQFIGETSLLQSIWRIASASGLAIELQILPAIATTTEAERRELAEQVRSQLQAGLNESH
jgi:1-acyl-sn-glycerol-3-phosphate acyltransferase